MSAWSIFSLDGFDLLVLCHKKVRTSNLTIRPNLGGIILIFIAPNFSRDFPTSVQVENSAVSSWKPLGSPREASPRRSHRSNLGHYSSLWSQGATKPSRSSSSSPLAKSPCGPIREEHEDIKQTLLLVPKIHILLPKESHTVPSGFVLNLPQQCQYICINSAKRFALNVF